MKMIIVENSGSEYARMSASIIREIVKDVYNDRVKLKEYKYKENRQKDYNEFKIEYTKGEEIDKTVFNYKLIYSNNSNTDIHTISGSISQYKNNELIDKRSTIISLPWNEFKQVIGRLTHRWLTMIIYDT